MSISVLHMTYPGVNRAQSHQVLAGESVWGSVPPGLGPLQETAPPACSFFSGFCFVFFFPAGAPVEGGNSCPGHESVLWSQTDLNPEVASACVWQCELEL